MYERGSKIHGVRNWEKGFSMSRGLDSAVRHIFQYIEGMRDEDHLAQAAWNLFAVMHFEEMIQRDLLPAELNDLPDYMPKAPKDYLLEPDDTEISAGVENLTAEEIQKKLEASLSMPLDAGQKALEETDKLIAECEKKSDPCLLHRWEMHVAGSTENAYLVQVCRNCGLEHQAGQALRELIAKYGLGPGATDDFTHWCSGQRIDLDWIDPVRLDRAYEEWRCDYEEPPPMFVDGYGFGCSGQSYYPRYPRF